MEKERNSSAVRFDIAWKTIFKVLAAILLALVAIKLWPLCKLLIVALLFAVPLYRLVLWACHKGWPRWTALLLASLVLVSAVIGFAALVGPMAFSQASNLQTSLPKLKQQLVTHIPAELRNPAEQALDSATATSIQKSVTAAKAALGGLIDVVLVIALTIYLMIDGPRALQWLVAFFPRRERPRVSKGLEKIGDRMVSYIVGQSIVSALFAGFVLALLSILHVPMALLLALLAGVLDVLPVIGISISLMLAGVMGLTVSPTTALIVLAGYGAYHVLENYFIIPKVYGKNLRLSTLAVLLSMIAGGMAAGVIGAIGVLPLVAAYPALESLWLAPELEPEVVTDHQAQLRRAA